MHFGVSSRRFRNISRSQNWVVSGLLLIWASGFVVTCPYTTRLRPQRTCTLGEYRVNTTCISWFVDVGWSIGAGSNSINNCFFVAKLLLRAETKLVTAPHGVRIGNAPHRVVRCIGPHAPADKPAVFANEPAPVKSRKVVLSMKVNRDLDTIIVLGSTLWRKHRCYCTNRFSIVIMLF